MVICWYLFSCCGQFCFSGFRFILLGLGYFDVIEFRLIDICRFRLGFGLFWVVNLTFGLI